MTTMYNTIGMARRVSERTNQDLIENIVENCKAVIPYMEMYWAGYRAGSECCKWNEATEVQPEVGVRVLTLCNNVAAVGMYRADGKWSVDNNGALLKNKDVKWKAIW